MIIYNKEGKVSSSEILIVGEFYLLKDDYRNNYGRGFEAIVMYEGKSKERYDNFNFKVISISRIHSAEGYIPRVGSSFERLITDSDITIREL